MLKRFPFLFLVILTANVFISCKPASKKDKAGTAEIQISFWHIMNYAGPREVIAAAVERFEADNPNCKVLMHTFENDAYKTKLSIEEASGNLPDVFFTWGGGPLVEKARAGGAIDLRSIQPVNDWEERFIGQALDLCRWNDGIYALPLDLSAVLLWCNSELFDKYNLQFPETFPELMAVIKKFNQEKITPIALGNSKQWPGAFFFSYLANRQGGTQLFLDASEQKSSASFADESFVLAGEYLKEMIDARAFTHGFNGIEDGLARAAFLREEAAMHLNGTWLIARVSEENPKFLQKMKVLPFPVLPGGKGDASTVLGGINCGFAVSSTCKHPEMAVKLLQYLTDKQVVTEWCSIGRLPAVKTSPEQEEKLPAISREALKNLQNAASLQPYYDQFLSSRLAVEHKKTTQNIFSGTMSAKEAAEQMAKKAEEVAKTAERMKR